MGRISGAEVTSYLQRFGSEHEAAADWVESRRGSGDFDAGDYDDMANMMAVCRILATSLEISSALDDFWEHSIPEEKQAEILWEAVFQLTVSIAESGVDLETASIGELRSVLQTAEESQVADRRLVVDVDAAYGRISEDDIRLEKSRTETWVREAQKIVREIILLSGPFLSEDLGGGGFE